MLNTVIQRLVLLASFAGLSSYLVWAKRRRIAAMAGPWFPPPGTETRRWTTLFRSTLHSGKDDTLVTGALREPVGNGKATARNKVSVAGDWLAPVIVWFLVISMGLAIVGFLIGER